MVNLKSILSLQTFSHIFFVLIILGVPIYEEAFSFQVVRQSGNQAVEQSGSRANWYIHSSLRFFESQFDQNFLNMGLRNKEILLTKNEQIFEAASYLPTALIAVGLAAQKQPEAGSSLAEQDHHEKGDHGGPPKVVFYQVLNFLLFAGLLFYLLKDKVKSFYQSRFDLFQKQFKAARREREEIESSYKDYQQKLEQINLTSEDQIKKASQEASATKARMLDEAHLEAERIQQSAQTLLDLEHKRTKRLIQAEFVEKIIDRIQSEISRSVTDEDKKALIRKFEVSLK